MRRRDQAAMQKRIAPVPKEPTRRPAVQTAKVQCPPLRKETLARPRLLDWLSAKTRYRAVLVTADAGFGKTTLLADFTRRTRQRTIWYRIDADDRDWQMLVRCLVSATREIESTFGEEVLALLGEGGGEANRQMAVEALVGEFQSVPSSETVLVLDDFHLIDDDPDCRWVVSQLIHRAPDHFCVVIASRRTPPLQIGKLRAAGEVSELTTDDLRFDASETAQLFGDAYGRVLESDVVDTLSRRTEGWIASLQLVQTALRDRSSSEARYFISTLRGDDQELYDYLAEVVVGELDSSLREFLMATSILQVVTPSHSAIVTALPDEEVSSLTSTAERLALLSKVSGGVGGRQLRYHPLVREFLAARLEAVHGRAHVVALHRAVAASMPLSEWAVAAHHYREAGDSRAMLATVTASISWIMANGQYALAESFIQGARADGDSPSANLVLGRLGLQHGDYDGAAQNAKAVLEEVGSDPVQRDHALMNLLAVDFNFGRGEEALSTATALRDGTDDGNLKSIAQATIQILTMENERDLESLNRHLRAMAGDQRPGRAHHYAVSMYNLAANSLAQDHLLEARNEIEQAVGAFGETSSRVERQAAEVLRIAVLLRLGSSDEAESAMRSILADDEPIQNDALLEAADAFETFGHADVAAGLFDRLGDRASFTLADQRVAAIVYAKRLIRRERPIEALRRLQEYPNGVPTSVGIQTWRDVIAAQIGMLVGEAGAIDRLSKAASRAASAGIHSARRFAELLRATELGTDSVADSMSSFGSTHPWHVTAAADRILPHLGNALVEKTVAVAVQTHPNHWRSVLRRALPPGPSANPAADLAAARLLEMIGEKHDVALLRTFAKSNKKSRGASGLGTSLARRVAVPVYVEDQGRVRVCAGDRTVDGSTVRRKVLALLCFLITRPDYSATRDQVLEALWPDLDPDTAVNSLNQTLYFLRRVLEADYDEDLTPGFVVHQGDVIWLDPELVSSRSTQCRRAIRSMPTPPSPDHVEGICRLYRGRFALDFEYEEWASTYRDSLHAEYLEIVERSLRADVEAGHHDRAISTARHALDADPRSDRLELSLVRLLRSTGAHSAAAEQYVHYAANYREELGLEPPPLDSL